MTHYTIIVQQLWYNRWPVKPAYFIQLKKRPCGGAEADMNIQIFGKSKCFDTKKAERWFKERNIKVQNIDLVKKGISRGELTSVMAAVGGLDALLDEKAAGYPLVKYLAYDEDKLEKALDDPGLLKTPIVRNGRKATVGYQPDVWAAWD